MESVSAFAGHRLRLQVNIPIYVNACRDASTSLRFPSR